MVFVEGDKARNPMNFHDRYEASIVDSLPNQSVLGYQIQPCRKNVRFLLQQGKLGAQSFYLAACSFYVPA